MMTLTFNHRNGQGHYGPTSLAKVLMMILVSWDILPSNRILLVASLCDNALAIAFARMQRSVCGTNFPFSCPDSFCDPNYDGNFGEMMRCTLDSAVQTSDGVSIQYSTDGLWNPGDGVIVPPSTVEGTYIQLSGSVQGTVQVLVSSTNECSALINDQNCACKMVYCNGDDSVLFPYPDCSNLGQGYLDFCDSVNYGSPGDLLKYLVSGVACGDITLGGGGTTTTTTTTTTGGGDTTSDTTTEGGDATTSDGGTSTTTSSGGEGGTSSTSTNVPPPTSSSTPASTGSMKVAPMRSLTMLLVAFLGVRVYLGF